MSGGPFFFPPLFPFFFLPPPVSYCVLSRFKAVELVKSLAAELYIFFQTSQYSFLPEVCIVYCA